MPRAIDIVRMVASRPHENYLSAFEQGDGLLQDHGITTPLRLAHFLAQVMHETDGLTIEWESGNYSAKRLLEIFGVGRHSAAVTPTEAMELAAITPLARKEQAIFERVYGVGNPRKSDELDNKQPGDGYRYRGGGILQTTGCCNYRRMGEKCGVDFLAHPELVVSAEHALKPALAEWSEDNLNAAADRDDIITITKRINGGLNGLDSRRAWLAKLKPLIKTVTFADPAAARARAAGLRAVEGGAAPGATPGGEGTSQPRGTGAGLLRRAREHIGEEYVNRQVPKDDANWKGPWDCAEFVSWLVFQEAGILYGCTDDNARPSEADAYTGAWQTDAERRGIRVSVDEAASTVGGIVLRFPPPGGMGHVALCDGKGGTVEAKGRQFGVVADTVHGRNWHTGVLVPGIKYDGEAETLRVKPPSDLYARGAPNMDNAVVIAIQKALAEKGFDPGGIDGDFGPSTEAAVVAFQNFEGLVVDGQVGPDTARALGISLTGIRPADVTIPGGDTTIKVPVESAKPDGAGSRSGQAPGQDQASALPIGPIGPGDGTMNPLILIAARVLPEIIKAIASDGTIAGDVAKAVTDITGAKTAEAARDKLNADPAAFAALQLKLAQIAADQEDKRQQAQLAMLKAQQEEEAKKRDAQLATLKAQLDDQAKRRDAELQTLRMQIEDTKDARARASSLATSPDADKWIVRAPPIVSYIVSAGFFAVLAILIFYGVNSRNNDQQGVLQLVNIVIGALTAAFTTVVSFWLGSSQGSKDKDRQIQQQAKDASDAQAKVIEAQGSRVDAVTIVTKPAGEAQKPPNALERCFNIVFRYETNENLKKMPQDDAREFYRTKYWNVMRCDDLPPGVDLVAFDFGLLATPDDAARALQKSIGAKEDGSVGDATIATTKTKTPRDIVIKMSELRLQFYRDKNALSSDLIARITAVRNAALEMIAAANPATALAA